MPAPAARRPRLPARPRRAGTRAVWGTLALAVTVACGPSTPVGGQSTADGRPAPGDARVDAAGLLRDSWVTDGRRGWFVDGAGSATRSPFSLYETAWRLRIAALPGHRTSVHIEPDRLASWVRRAEEGRLDSSGLPAVAQVDLAVDALLTAGGTVDRTRVAATLEALRDGGGYRTGRAAAASDPGATAVAVRVLTRLGLPVPGPVRSANARAVARLSPRDAAARPGRVVPALETAAALGTTGASRDRAGALTQAAVRALARLDADPVRLASEAALRRTADRLGVRLPRFDPATCDGQVLPDGGIGLPGAERSDPQATYWALRLGCSAVRAPAPGAHSRAGWPTEQARESALSASTAAMTVARTTGHTDEFAAELTRQVREVWLPRLEHHRPPYRTADLADRVNLRLLARTLGPPETRHVTRRLPPPSPRGIRATDEARLLLAALDASGSPSARRTLCAAGSPLRQAPHGTGGSLVRAARLTAAADTCDDPELRRRAMATARRSRASDAVYRAGDTVSFEASVLGTWVERPRTDAVAAWTAAGLCRADRCAETPAHLPTTDHTPLRTLAALLTARSGDYAGLFPVAL